MQSGRRHETSRKFAGLHVTSECLLMDLEQAKDETLREPERAQGRPDTDGQRQPSEHVASAVSMAGQVAQQLCPDAGRVALFVARFAEDLGRLAASDKGWKASGDPGGQYGGAISTGASRLTPEPAGNTRLQTKAFQEAGGIVRIRGLALCRQRRPRGRSQQAPGGHPLAKKLSWWQPRPSMI